MKKRYLALLLVVALLVCAAVLTVGAETTETLPTAPAQLTSELEIDGSTATGYCPHCCETVDQTVTWTEYVPADTTAHHIISTDDPDTALHYFLNDDYTRNGALRPATNDMELVLHLNGHTYTRTDTTGCIFPNDNITGTKTYIVDNAQQAGTLHNSAGRGQTVTLSLANSELTLYSGNLTSAATSGNTTDKVANYYGGIVDLSATGCKFTMFGGKLSNGVANRGGAIYGTSKTTVYICGGTIENCTAYNRGGGIYLTGSGAKLYMNGGIIQNCYYQSGTGSTTAFGGNMYLESGAAAYISGGTIQNGNKAPDATTASYGKVSGGNICARAASVYISDNAVIADGMGQYGGNIYCENGKVTISGGTVSGGSATDNGGNICVKEINADLNTGLTISGGTIKNGADAGTGPNIYVRGYYSSTSGTARLPVSISGGNICVDAADLTYTVPGAGVYVDGYTDLTVSGAANIKDIVTTGETGQGAIYVNTNAKLTMTGGEISNCTAYCGGAIYMAGGTVDLQGGLITGCKTPKEDSQYGGNIYQAGGTLLISQNAEITKGEANRGGNIYCDGTLTMTGGQVTGGLTGSDRNATHGGNIWFHTNADATISSGIISGGSVSADGGNIYAAASGAKVVVSGNAQIKDGYAGRHGGNVANSLATGMQLNGGTISGGTSVQRGENLYVNTGSVELNGVNIGASSTTKNNASVQVYSGTLTIKGETVIENHEGTNAAIQVTDAAGTLKMEGGTIRNCHSSKTAGLGGAIYAEKGNNTGDPNVIISGGIIQNCSAFKGGAIYAASSADVSISGENTSIQDCFAYERAGGIMITNADTTLNMTGGTIRNCYIDPSSTNPFGGNIYVENAEATISGGTVENGNDPSDENVTAHSTVKGGNICCRKGSAEISGTALIQNGVGSDGDNIGVENATVKLNGGTVYGSTTDSIKLWNTDTTVLELGNVTFPETESSRDEYERINLTGSATTALATVKVKDFNSAVCFNFITKTDSDFSVGDRVPRIEVDSESNSGTGAYYVMNDAGTRLPAAINATAVEEGEISYPVGTCLVIAGVTGFINDTTANGQEIPVSAIGATYDKDGTPTAYDMYKLYASATYVMEGDAVVDLNNQTATIDTNGYKLSPVDYRTDSAALPKSKLTVTGNGTMELYTQNPVNNYKYLVVGHDAQGEVITDGSTPAYYTANRIGIQFTQVSVRPSIAGIYYTTKLVGNANVAPFISAYGVALCANDETGVPSENFASESGVMYTENIVDESPESYNLKTYSCLLEGILSTDVVVPEGSTAAAVNNWRGAEVRVYANAYIWLSMPNEMVNAGYDKDIIMADESCNYTMQEIMQAVDALDSLNSTKKVVNFYNTWRTLNDEELMAGWGLNKIEEAWQAEYGTSAEA